MAERDTSGCGCGCGCHYSLCPRPQELRTPTRHHSAGSRAQPDSGHSVTLALVRPAAKGRKMAGFRAEVHLGKVQCRRRYVGPPLSAVHSAVTFK
jgi:hypothetical protein